MRKFGPRFRQRRGSGEQPEVATEFRRGPEVARRELVLPALPLDRMGGSSKPAAKALVAGGHLHESGVQTS